MDIMAGDSYQVPDLASVLRTLASLAPQDQKNGAEESLRQQIHESQRQPPIGPHQTPQLLPQSAKLQKSTAFVQTAGQKLTDPATIIDWPSGLRCVMKTVAAHDNIIKEIRRMITIQQEHEEQWWNGRKALLQRQEARKEGQKKLDEVLKAVGGAVAVGNTKSGSDEAVEELKTFEMKVYRAQHQMVKEMSAKLKSLGVPFFGTKTELVRKPGTDPTPIGGFGAPGETRKLINEIELVELQRRMLNLLEELCDE